MAEIFRAWCFYEMFNMRRKCANRTSKAATSTTITTTTKNTKLIMFSMIYDKTHATSLLSYASKLNEFPFERVCPSYISIDYLYNACSGNVVQVFRFFFYFSFIHFECLSLSVILRIFFRKFIIKMINFHIPYSIGTEFQISWPFNRNKHSSKLKINKRLSLYLSISFSLSMCYIYFYNVHRNRISECVATHEISTLLSTNEQTNRQKKYHNFTHDNCHHSYVICLIGIRWLGICMVCVCVCVNEWAMHAYTFLLVCLRIWKRNRWISQLK